MNVLLGMGGSPDGFDALEETLTRARDAGDELTVAVLDTSDDHDPDDVESEIRDRVDEAGVEASVTQLPGHPGSQLSQFAEREEFDRIVIGGGQRSPMGKIELGEVAEFVLLNADTTVTLVR
ncbi:universal stress protein [Halosimplex litoreum]|uniref:Universal stress protein n=1 Tax=Halosimplex litoreum TaxID=1198301 RepID=A0A7T3KVQ7_9EURY|nr:universal stress protein [Halosimplex litoreum]QPV63075.1 universal stress protein [Halosimplex litoreum]